MIALQRGKIWRNLVQKKFFIYKVGFWKTPAFCKSKTLHIILSKISPNCNQTDRKNAPISPRFRVLLRKKLTGCFFSIPPNREQPKSSRIKSAALCGRIWNPPLRYKPGAFVGAIHESPEKEKGPVRVLTKIVNCPLSIVNCPLSIVNCPLLIVNSPLSFMQIYARIYMGFSLALFHQKPNYCLTFGPLYSIIVLLFYR